MSQLTYKTRGMSSPQGKSRVYFCAHGEDFVPYLEEIASDILNRENCAIWYKTDPQAELTEQSWEDLSRMQLFIMPVTARLLQTDNSALKEFAFAIAHHIPVLPLMQERGLADLFNQKCGELQFLDKYANDATAISFDEKLNKFLSSTLVGDELAARIRSAFDAYVFLSYRKKDRKYAQELMRLIHKNDFCRDIAIWYDEFLTPGENFNDAILAALKKSDLFVLTVTPNLVNEVNYVMTEEYPAACREHKPIIPATMVETDAAALAEKYRGLPPCTDAGDEAALSQTLLTAVRSLALKENDTSPTHNFFIGLAYLNGVDVEVDHARALTLIKSAAEAGLEEAAEKLVSMYEKGEGVPRNYELAADWLEKFSTLVAKRYHETQSEAAGHRHIEVLLQLGQLTYDMGQFQRAKIVYGLARKRCDKLLTRFDDDFYRQKLSFCYLRLGDIARRDALEDESRDAFEKALALDTHLAEKSGTAENLYALSRTLERLGNHCLRTNDLEKAEEYYLRTLSVSEQAAQKETSLSTRRGVAFSHSNLGNLYHRKGDAAAAVRHKEKAVALCAALLEENPDASSHADLASFCRSWGMIWNEQKEYEKAKECYLRALQLSETAYEKRSTPMLQRDISLALSALGELCRLRSDHAAALEYFHKAEHIQYFILYESRSLRAMRELASTYHQISRCHQEQEDLESAISYLKSSVRHSREAQREGCNARQDLEDLENTLSKLEEIYTQREDYAAALDCAKELCDVTRHLFYQSKTPAQYQRVVKRCYRVMMYAEKCDKVTRELAEEYYVMALDFAYECLESYADKTVLHFGIVCGAKLAIFLEKKGHKKAAAFIYLRTLYFTKYMTEDFSTPNDWKNLNIAATHLHALRDLMREKGNLELACDAFRCLLRHFTEDSAYPALLADMEQRLAERSR